ncbi:Cleavage and polyadenylation specificity factor subunit, partial [Homarus americanus]
WTTDNDIAAAVQNLGVNDFLDVKFFENRANGQSKGFCAISLGSDPSSRLVMEKLPRKEIHGMNPVVTFPSKQALNQVRISMLKPTAAVLSCDRFLILSLRAKLEQVLSINIVAALVVQVAIQVEAQGAPEDLECHHQVVACLHQGWNIDHQVRLGPTVHMEVHMAAHTEAPMGVPMVVLMVLMVHMVLLVDHMVLLVDHMVDHMAVPMVAPMVALMVAPMVAPMDPLDLMDLQVWVLIMDLTKVLHVDLHLTTCKVGRLWTNWGIEALVMEGPGPRAPPPPGHIQRPMHPGGPGGPPPGHGGPPPRGPPPNMGPPPGQHGPPPPRGPPPPMDPRAPPPRPDFIQGGFPATSSPPSVPHNLALPARPPITQGTLTTGLYGNGNALSTSVCAGLLVCGVGCPFSCA